MFCQDFTGNKLFLKCHSRQTIINWKTAGIITFCATSGALRTSWEIHYFHWFGSCWFSTYGPACFCSSCSFKCARTSRWHSDRLYYHHPVLLAAAPSQRASRQRGEGISSLISSSEENGAERRRRPRCWMRYGWFMQAAGTRLCKRRAGSKCKRGRGPQGAWYNILLIVYNSNSHPSSVSHSACIRPFTFIIISVNTI